MLRLLPTTVAVLAALALPLGAYAQPAAPSTRPATAPTMPVPTAPSIPARIGTPVTPATVPPMDANKRLDINAASEQDLASLPGVGPVTAKAIVAGRPWDDLADLVKKKAMSKPAFERNKDHLALANINSSSAADMAKTLPGIGDATAPKIVAGRPYAAPQELVSKKVLTERQFDKIKNVITY